ncbi:L-serine ammonia-lyase [Mycolicibacterium sp. CBM1]
MTSVSVFDLFSIGVGPSSSHTVGPMRAARSFAVALDESSALTEVTRIRVELFGSLGATGVGHGTDRAVILGLEGAQPATVDGDALITRAQQVRSQQRVHLLGRHWAALRPEDLVLHTGRALDYHPNGMRFTAFNAQNAVLAEETCFSIGGGTVIRAAEISIPQVTAPVPHPFSSAVELLERCRQHSVPISAVMLDNEAALRPRDEVRAGILDIWSAMQECIARGLRTEGVLPGGLGVPRRAPALLARLRSHQSDSEAARFEFADWVMLYALAVNEENAAGGRVVTAPTNGAAGVVPAVLSYYRWHVPGASDTGVVRFLLTAGAIGALIKTNASISGADVGCQGEIGAACAMAAAGLCEVLGGAPGQVENAAEIGIEHNLGLTCDPVGGLVQVPCIERNAVAAVKAISAARIALHGDGRHLVSLDTAVATMRATGADMDSRYKETSLGGLAVNVIEC